MADSSGTHEISNAFEMARNLDLEGSFGFLFRRLNSLANALFSEATAQTELTAMQAGVLLTIYQQETLGLRELARRMHVDRSTLQEVVNRMTARRLIGRRVPDSDRRTYELWVTPKGCELLLRHVHAMSGLQQRLMNGIDADKAATTMSVLKQILQQHDY